MREPHTATLPDESRPRARRPRPGFVWRVSIQRRLLMLLVMLLWIGLVLYPDPRSLAASVRRLVDPPVDVAAVRHLADALPDDPAAVEAFSQRYVKYEYAWTLYGKPWYFPTVSEVVADRAGDCQAEAILTASILKAKGLPYTFRYSFDHVWVDYPGKAVNALEDPATSFVSNQGTGWLASLPDKIPLHDIVEQRIRFHWTPMPAERKGALVLGVMLAFLIGERLLDLIWRPTPRPRPVDRRPQES